MKKKLYAIILVIATFIGAPAMLVATTAPAWAFNCETRSDSTGDVWFTSGTDDLARATIYWQYCREYNLNGTLARRYAKADWSVNMYNADGSTMSCNAITRRLDGFRFNWKFYRWDGVEWNPGPIEVACDESTINSESQFYELAPQPRLWWMDDAVGFEHPPRWNLIITRMNNNNPDDQKVIDRAFTP